MLKTLFNMIWMLLKWPLYIICAIIVFFYLIVFLHLLYQIVVKKKRPKKAKSKHNYKRKPLKDLFWYFPQQCALDMLNKNPDAFPYQGVIIFEGRQGYGKTISMMEFTRLMQLQYPDVKCLCNISYEYRDGALTHWRQLLKYENGEEGVIVDIDEIQNWFNSKDSKDFPPEMLTTITTNRKNARIVCGTAQQFYMIAKDIRTQTTEVRSCRTFMGCLTFVIRKFPIVESDGTIRGYKYLGMYFFAHKPVLRESYDTKEMVDRLADVGFNERPPEVKVDMSQFR
ncbi:MAG: AAA family ATPase [Lachnospiraceae bacterium]|nr:AAA family ATPase [Lachnospiraceae bacterium]